MHTSEFDGNEIFIPLAGGPRVCARIMDNTKRSYCGGRAALEIDGHVRAVANPNNVDMFYRGPFRRAADPCFIRNYTQRQSALVVQQRDGQSHALWWGANTAGPCLMLLRYIDGDRLLGPRRDGRCVHVYPSPDPRRSGQRSPGGLGNPLQ